MKNQIKNLAIIVCLATLALAGCNPAPKFGETEKKAISDTIDMLMNKIDQYAEEAKPDSTFQWLSDDSACIFMSGGLAYSKKELLPMFSDMYKTIKGQSIETVSKKITVLSPDAVVWVGILKGFMILTNDTKQDQYLMETWLWQRETSGWRVTHYHESYLNLPGPAAKAAVEKATAGFAKTLTDKSLKPTDMPPMLTDFLKKNPEIYGSTLAFAVVDENGQKKEAAPYVYRAGKEFKQVDIPASYDYSVAEWYASPVSAKAPVWSNPYYDGGVGNVVMVTYGIPLYDKNNNLIGVLTADLEIR